MLSTYLLGAVSVTSLFVHAPQNEVLEPVFQPVHMGQEKPMDADQLTISERLLYMTPAKEESQPLKEMRTRIMARLDKEEKDRAKDETVKRTEAEKKKRKEAWLAAFPVLPGESAEATFINTIARDVIAIAHQNNLYPSVMMAQAGLESNWGRSGLATNYNNLMGTKGSWKGKTVVLNTREEYNGQSVYIDANFSVYDSWKDSLTRYGGLLRNGPGENNASFYAGTWRSNAQTYADATAWLQGRYATDNHYAEKLNATIEAYGLDRYDAIQPLDETLKTVQVEVKPEQVALTAPKGVYEVQPGDSLFGIALAHNRTIQELMNWNTLQTPLLEERQWVVVSYDQVKRADKEAVTVLDEMKIVNKNGKVMPLLTVSADKK